MLPLSGGIHCTVNKDTYLRTTHHLVPLKVTLVNHKNEIMSDNVWLFVYKHDTCMIVNIYEVNIPLRNKKTSFKPYSDVAAVSWFTLVKYLALKMEKSPTTPWP